MSPVRSDAYPEGISARAKCGHIGGCGCEAAGCCFKCPLEECIHVSHGQAKIRLRDTKIVKLAGTVREIAELAGVSLNTVYRARKRVTA